MIPKPNALVIFDQKGVVPDHHIVSGNPFRDVLTFMVACGQLPLERSAEPDATSVKSHFDLPLFNLYMTFCFEEFKETIDAYNEYLAEPTVEKLGKVIDGLFDSQWVAMGAMLASGTPIRLTWMEGAHTNLSKIDAKTGEVIKDANGKIMKPKGWHEPRFAQILEETLHETQVRAADLDKAKKLWVSKTQS